MKNDLTMRFDASPSPVPVGGVQPLSIPMVFQNASPIAESPSLRGFFLSGINEESDNGQSAVSKTHYFN